MIDFVKVGMRIGEHRKRLGLSQEELAAKLYVTRQAVSKWENGTSVPSIDALSELSALFGVSFEEILGLFERSPKKVNPDNIFEGHDRGYIISKIISGDIKLDIPRALVQMSPAERMCVLNAVKTHKINVRKKKLMGALTPYENKFLYDE